VAISDAAIARGSVISPLPSDEPTGFGGVMTEYFRFWAKDPHCNSGWYPRRVAGGTGRYRSFQQSKRLCASDAVECQFTYSLKDDRSCGDNDFSDVSARVSTYGRSKMQSLPDLRCGLGGRLNYFGFKISHRTTIATFL